MREKIVLFDGNSIVNRAFYGLPELSNSEGLHTNGIYGFLNIMFKILDEEQPQYMAIAFDLKAPTFRHKLYEGYKGTRKGMPPELAEQMPILKELLRAMNICTVEKEGYEADDLLGTMAKKMAQEGMDVSLISGDRDLLQIASDQIKIRIPKTKRTGTEIEDYYEKDVLETYHVTPAQIIELKALMGDSSDNIPGIPGVGEKTATKIIMEYGTIENAYAHVEEIKPNKAKESLREHYDLAQLSKKLATINTDSPLELTQDQIRIGEMFTENAFEIIQRLEFKNFFSRFPKEVKEKTSEISFREVTDLGEMEGIFAEAGKRQEIGLFFLKEEKTLLGCALSLSKEETYYIPVQGFVTQPYLQDQMDEVLSKVASAATFGLKEQLLFLRETPHRKKIADLEVAAYLINPLKETYPYEDLAREYLGENLASKTELFGKRTLRQVQEEEPEKIVKYAGAQAYTALCVREILMELLEEMGMRQLYDEVEMPLVYTLSEMERWGVLVEGEALKTYGEQLCGRIEELEQEIYTLAGEKFNINSPKQLGVILFEKMKLPNGKKTKTGYSTAADVLEKLAGDYPIVSLILEYRQLAKLKSTYADGLAVFIGEDGRIHTTFNQTITATGRLSSTEPNLQNIPVRMELGRLIRKVFVPEEGFVFVDADYSQIELRILAHMSGDQVLIEAYRQAQDIHRLTASQVFHVPFEEVTDLQRRNAKAVNFGIVYGISSFGLSQGLSITRKEAADYIEQYFKTYPKIKQCLDHLVEEGKEKGYVSSLFGRRRPIPELKSSNFMQRSFGERIAMNSPIQGTAADVIKIAMNRVQERLKKEGMRSRLVLQVHDELLVETAREEVEEVKKILREEMMGAAQLAVELEVDVHEGGNWYEAK
ncbi:MAG: DNA polymerase I [Lachnospiraceae bacterium]|nr:DNA polymerase I [Robinsoniella sp.]MDY3765342.1 DNA polymerase I [Lachnospiraceae bacterium]